MYYIYAYYEPDFSNPFYIGKGKGLRALVHYLNSKELNRCDMFHNKLRSMLNKGIKPIIKILFDNLEEDVAFELEILLIKKYGRRDLGTGCLCNMTDGGNSGISGIKMPNETRLKISKSLIGRERSYDYRINISKSQKKRKDIRKTTQERYGHPVESFDLVSKETLFQFASISEASRYYKIGHSAIIQCLKGLRKSSCGVGWRYTS